jgi:hypothetical protein
MTLVAYLALVVAVAALLCGHQSATPPLPPREARRGLYGRLTGEQAPRASQSTPQPHRPSHAPLWARSQPHSYEETG